MRTVIAGALALLVALSAWGAETIPILDQIRGPLATLSAPITPIPTQGIRYAQACCKRCSKGKACGDSCISRQTAVPEGKRVRLRLEHSATGQRTRVPWYGANMAHED